MSLSQTFGTAARVSASAEGTCGADGHAVGAPTTGLRGAPEKGCGEAVIGLPSFSVPPVPGSAGSGHTSRTNPASAAPEIRRRTPQAEAPYRSLSGSVGSRASWPLADGH